MNVPIELKTRIYEHIGIVQQHLGELPPDEQREILQSLETHIHDALETRSSGQPTLDELEAIISEMDPPESYGPVPILRPVEKDSPAPPRSIGRGFFIKLLLAALIIIIYQVFDYMKSGRERSFSKETDAQESAIEPGISAAATTNERPGETKPKLAEERDKSLPGKWVTIDFVSSVSDFNPQEAGWTNDFTLKCIEFLPDGKTDKPWWTWKDKTLFHSGDQSEAEMMILEYNRTVYLFIEWISGDVLNRNAKPRYHVLKRGTYIDPETPKTIIEGVGWDALRIGATREQLIREFGPAKRSSDNFMSWKDHHFSCNLREDKVTWVHFSYRGFAGITTKGIKKGSTEEEVLRAYGNPESISARQTGKEMSWPEHGLVIYLADSEGVVAISTTEPGSP